MVFKPFSDRAGAALPFIGIVLALANWYARPVVGLAWSAAIVMFMIMVAVRRVTQRAFHREPTNVALARSFAAVNLAVVFGAVMMVIPLAVTLANTYGLVDEPDFGKRTTMIIIGAYLVVIGNAMPRNLPPLSSMQGDGARVQAFHRLIGWTWVLCGLGWIAAWLALPIDAARPVSMAVVAAALIGSVVQLLRFRKPRPHAPGVS